MSKFTPEQIQKKKERLQEALQQEKDIKIVTNLFSASAWNNLPQKIKTYLEKYRDEK